MYLPPLWFHHVTALSTSISVSIWTRFEETQVMHQSIRYQLPFKSSWPKQKLALAGRMFLEMLLDRLDGESQRKEFFKEVFEQRFAHLAEIYPNLLTNVSFCPQDLLPFTPEEILQEVGKEFEKIMQKQIAWFGSATNLSRRNIWLGNFCEQLAHTVASLENIFSFLRDLSRC